MSGVYVEHLALPPYNRPEILRYSGAKEADPQLEALLNSCLAEAEGTIQGRVCYAEFPISAGENGLDLGFTTTASRLLQTRLAECQRLVLFAATIGVELDRLITRYARLSPARALLFQAIGAERIEALCDAFEAAVQSRCRKGGEQVVGRVSPGYGDIPLAMQQAIFTALDCSRKIGLSLNDSLLMSPTKSVTAIIGIQKSDGNI